MRNIRRNLENNCKHINKDELKKAINEKDTKKLEEFKQKAMNCVYCKKILMKVMAGK